MPLDDGTLLIAADGSRQLDATGTARMASATDDSCCCGGCPEECLPCGDCCYDTESPWPGGARLLVTVETLVCHYPDGYDCLSSDPYYVYCEKVANISLSSGPTPGSWMPPYPPNMLNWGDSGWVLATGRGTLPYTGPCEYVEPTGDPDEYVLYIVEFNCETKHWYLWGVCEYTDLGIGDCDGIDMTSFVFEAGYECSAGKTVTRQLRVKIEVVGNDDCMAV